MWYKSTEMLYKITRFCTKFCTKSHDFVRALSGVKQINTYLISKRPRSVSVHNTCWYEVRIVRDGFTSRFLMSFWITDDVSNLKTLLVSTTYICTRKNLHTQYSYCSFGLLVRCIFLLCIELSVADVSFSRVW